MKVKETRWMDMDDLRGAVHQARVVYAGRLQSLRQAAENAV